CSECEEFLCTKCFEDHQWFFKKRNHEARRVEELRADSAHRFLEDSRKSCNLFCSSPGHANQGHISSIYCPTCEKALCCSCALLDNQHTQFRDVRDESRRRQEELSAMSRELRRNRSSFEAAYAELQDEAARLERAQRETRELIGQRVEQLVRWIRREEEELLGLVEARQEQGRRELARELRRVEGVLRRMEAGERLVEKMNLYGTEQEVMDMQPFIKASLEELRQQEELVQPTFTISLAEMHTSPALPVMPGPKRGSHCMEQGSQMSPKLLKLECDPMPVPSHPSPNRGDGRKVTSIIICSSEDSEEDTAAEKFLGATGAGLQQAQGQQEAFQPHMVREWHLTSPQHRPHQPLG
ncbi:PREDICTED: protein PML-like, partial [Tauraco erythrolophus]|uniref:protein PML-like n=1 Tax=Tauraco erythrolophus TaxID=121530 RepID=UPI0005231037